MFGGQDRPGGAAAVIEDTAAREHIGRSFISQTLGGPRTGLSLGDRVTVMSEYVRLQSAAGLRL